MDISKRRMGTSRERLAEISHHFLSSDNADIHADTVIFPVLLQRGYYSFPLYALCQAFRARHKVADVLYFNSVSDEVKASKGSPGEKTLEKRLTEMFGNGRPEICLVPLDFEELAVLRSFNGCVLVPVPTSLDGIRWAYLAIKRLLQEEDMQSFGIVMVDAMDRKLAHSHFEKLGEGVSRFLGLRLTCHGCLLSMTSTHIQQEVASAERGKGQLSAGLGPIADSLLEEWCNEHNDSFDNGADQGFGEESLKKISEGFQ